MPLIFIILLIASLWFLGWQYMVTLLLVWVFFTYKEKLNWWNRAFLVLLLFITWLGVITYGSISAIPPEAAQFDPYFLLTAILFWMYWQRRKTAEIRRAMGGIG